MSSTNGLFNATALASATPAEHTVNNRSFHQQADGTFLLMETVRYSPGSGSLGGGDIFQTTIQRIESDGSLDGPPTVLFNHTPERFSYGAEFAEAPDGSLFAFLEEYPGSDTRLRIVEVAEDGSALGAETQLELSQPNTNGKLGFLQDGSFYQIFQQGSGETAEILLEIRADFGSEARTQTLAPVEDLKRLEGVFEADDDNLIIHWLRDDDTYEPFDGKPDGPGGPYPDGYGETHFEFLTLNTTTLETSEIVSLTPPATSSDAERSSIVSISRSGDDFVVIWQHDFSDHSSSSARTQRAVHGPDGAITGPVLDLATSGQQVEALDLGSGLTMLFWSSVGSYYDTSTRVGATVYDADGRIHATYSPVDANSGGNVSQTDDGIFITGFTYNSETDRTSAQSQHLEFRPPLELTEEADSHTNSESGATRGLSGDDLLMGSEEDDILDGGAGNDTLLGGAGNDVLLDNGGSNFFDGGAGEDWLVLDLFAPSAEDSGSPEAWLDDFTVGENVEVDPDGTVTLQHDGATQTFRNIERLAYGTDYMSVGERFFSTVFRGDNRYENVWGRGEGGDSFDRLVGQSSNDTLVGKGGDDTLIGGLGHDELHGDDGNDYIHGASAAEELFEDLADTIYAGAGDDTLFGGHGNDLVFGMDGNDIIAGGAGVDQLAGQGGDDVITGSAYSDLIFGNAGNDFVNGGFGHDRINGGDGADKFFHAGVLGHGSDWVQDYIAADGDVLLWGGGPATADDFQVNFAHTANDAGERAGDDAVQEAFVIYKPTGQIIWALVDGEGQSSINLQIGGDTFDLLA